MQFNKTGEFKQVLRAFELRGHTSGIQHMAFNSDTSRVATVSKDGTWRLYNIQGEYIFKLEANVGTCRISWSPRGAIRLDIGT